MIFINYKNSPKEFEITHKGHADFAEKEKDIVCAAVSVLFSELLFAAKKSEAEGNITSLGCKAESGDAFLRFEYTQNPLMREIIVIILECLKALECEYKENITISPTSVGEREQNVKVI